MGNNKREKEIKIISNSKSINHHHLERSPTCPRAKARFRGDYANVIRKDDKK